ncbi:hypothetical protein CHS0354_041063 [Potamilus streckersoni]|uniref:Uncharacterized protein n=1 Tax=Potamilus streckersoni TaxID=2493646 RepID=A0AAE0SDV7_9BIVA|nr:hypothetical protein CHS0354_041063 [Potamilus streckersoni]
MTLSICTMLVIIRLLAIMLLISFVFSLPLEEKDSNLKTAVTVREMLVEEIGHRSIRSIGMPEKKRFIFRLNGVDVELDLQLNNLIRDDVSVHVTENGVTKLMKPPKDDKEVSSGNREYN